MLRGPIVIRWYSSKVISTWAGLPRSVMNTGPLLAARFAPLVSRLNSPLEKDFIDTASLYEKSNVNTLQH